MQLKLFPLAAITLICFNNTYPGTASEQTLTYANIGNLVIKPDLVITPQKSPLGAVSQGTCPEKATPEEKLTVVVPTPFEQKTIWFSLLQAHCPLMGATCLLDATALEKLHLLGEADSGHNNCLLAQLPTLTVFGNAAAAAKLANPATNLNDAQRSQLIVKFFMEHEPACTLARQSLDRLSNNQGLFLATFQEQDEMTKQTFQQLYFNHPQLIKLNSSVMALGLLRSWQALNNTPHLFPARIIKSAMFNKCVNKFMADVVMPHYMNFIFKLVAGRAPNPSEIPKMAMPDVLTMGINAYAGQGNPSSFKTMLTNINTNVPWLPQATVFGLLGSITEIIENRTTDRATITQTHNAVLLHMKTKLVAVSRVTTSLRELHELVASSDILKANLPNAQALNDLFTTRGSLGQLIDLLKTDTFTSSGSALTESARILTAYHLLCQHKEQFIAALNVAGMIDAFSAATELAKDQHYSLVNFTEQAAPIIQMDGFWNPLIAHSKAIKNNIAIGGSANNNMIITGPNGSGKSVFMQGMALSIVYAQSFGIVPADKATMSLFNHLYIYLNVQENLQEKMSTFMAEMQKLDQICALIQSLPAHEKSFTLIDEPLKGTVEKTGGPLIYKAAKGINTPHNITLLATHFKLPTSLEADTKGEFTNYHVGLFEQTVGSFTRSFQLIKGANLWWFNDDAKRERFIDWLSRQN